jgi:hypothetical protein
MRGYYETGPVSTDQRQPSPACAERIAADAKPYEDPPCCGLSQGDTFEASGRKYLVHGEQRGRLVVAPVTG